MTLSDFAAVHSYSSSEDTARYMLWGPNTPEETALFIQGNIRSAALTNRIDYDFIVERSCDGMVIGGCGVDVNEQLECAAVGYIIEREQWGNGYATELTEALITFAFTVLKVKFVYATCDSRNVASYRVMEKCGMRRESCLTSVRPPKNAGEKWGDELRYVITKREWKQIVEHKNETLKLVLPEERHKAEWLLYQAELDSMGEESVPGALLSSKVTFDEFLENTVRYRTGSDIPNNHVPATLFFAELDGEIVGAIDVRHHLSEFLQNVGGHIGYGVRPSYRRRDIGKVMLKKALEFCKGRGMDRVLITCDESNIGSQKIILSGGGVEDTPFTEDDGNVTLRFFIDLT